MIPNSLPGVIWCLRRGSWTTGVRTADNDTIVIQQGLDFLTMSRRDARLLAKRINECLDATRRAS
jgi:hypothetical protein